MKISRLSLCLSLVVGVAACKKDSVGSDQPLPTEFKPKPADVDTSKLKAPTLFASIPSDTPYVVAAFEAVPLDYYAKMKAALGPTFQKSFTQIRAMEADGLSTKPGMLEAVMTELDGKWNQAGLESLGFSATPRFALYGLGIVPAVFRLEVKDDKAVLATIERIAKKADQTLPALETRDGRSFWRFAQRKADLVVAFADNQLIVAIGPAASIDAKLPLILGIEKPAQNMADGKALGEVMKKHGFGPHLIGYADSRLLATQAMTFAGMQPSAACTSELDRVTAMAPRLVVGYSELSVKRATGGMVLELAPDLLKMVEALRTDVPGLGVAMSDEPLAAFGGGVDLAGGQKLGLMIATTVGKLGDACQWSHVQQSAEEMRASLGKPLPAEITSVRGGILAIQSVSFGGRARNNPIPDAMEAFAVVSSGDAKGLVAALMKLAPPLQQLGLETDGKLHKLGGGMLPIPFDVYAGVGDKAVVVGVGNKGQKLAEKMIDAPSGGKSPFLVMSYDYGKFVELRAQMLPDFGDAEDGGLDKQASDDLSKLFGRATVSIDVNDKGLVMWGSMEMK
ncbi:MAG: hypothetical protein H6Q90_1370 [Deltaproteobacteria bacterium]|nr:hypothetical protein [Deltaproteobacteria bacterium]